MATSAAVLAGNGLHPGMFDLQAGGSQSHHAGSGSSNNDKQQHQKYALGIGASRGLNNESMFFNSSSSSSNKSTAVSAAHRNFALDPSLTMHGDESGQSLLEDLNFLNMSMDYTDPMNIQSQNEATAHVLDQICDDLFPSDMITLNN